MNVDWALAELDRFLELTVMRTVEYESVAGMFELTAAPDEKITSQAVVVEKILDRVTPNWRESLEEFDTFSSHWRPLRNAVIRCRAALARDAELKANLGDNAPEVSASAFHPWIWGGASSLWQSGHFREAVDGAIKKLNAETQNKVGRRDVSETDLFKQAFTLEPAQPGKARLRRMKDDRSKTYRNLHVGAMSLADGIFTAIRNPVSHEADFDFPEQQALEYLAALSVLARWVDDATVETAGDTL